MCGHVCYVNTVPADCLNLYHGQPVPYSCSMHDHTCGIGRYHIHVDMIAHVVSANHPIYTMVSRYHMCNYVCYVNVVLADHSTNKVVGRYYIHVAYMFAYVVSAEHGINRVIGQYCIYVAYMAAHVVPADHPIYTMVGRYYMYMSSAGCRLVPLLRPFVLSGGPDVRRVLTEWSASGPVCPHVPSTAVNHDHHQ